MRVACQINRPSRIQKGMVEDTQNSMFQGSHHRKNGTKAANHRNPTARTGRFSRQRVLMPPKDAAKRINKEMTRIVRAEP